MDTKNTKFSRFDQVKIVTTRNVSYLSAPPGSTVSPKGIWQVSAAIDNDLLLIKDSCIIRIPAADVLKVVDYNVRAITAKFGRLSEYVQEPRSSGENSTKGVERTSEAD